MAHAIILSFNLFIYFLIYLIGETQIFEEFRCLHQGKQIYARKSSGKMAATANQFCALSENVSERHVNDVT